MYKNQFEEWLANSKKDPDILAELESIKNNGSEIEDRFYKELKFGTAGLRGVLGAGTNRMNIFTVGKATQGLADYLNDDFDCPKVAIAYDSRKNSQLFAEYAASVLAANGIHVYIYSELMPTPMLSYAVRALDCSAGIVVTASHNPAQYNGYKVYGSDGCQITDDAAAKITAYISKTDIWNGVKNIDFADAEKTGKIEFISDSVIDSYFEEVYKKSVTKGADNSMLKVVFTPLNGAGNKPVRRMLEHIGVNNVYVVKEQEQPDSSFATCPYPNPEIREALQKGLELCVKTGADLLLATDPDCDRVGTAVLHNGEYILINGNQMGILALDFICSNSDVPEGAVAVKSIVSSEMARTVAKAHGVKMIDVLTGFKYIGEQIAFLEEDGHPERFIFGFEESYGYLSGTYARDKDAVNASMIICEMAAHYKREGKTLIDVLESLYAKFGYYYDKVINKQYDGSQGMKIMADIMQSFRDKAPACFGGISIKASNDYLLKVRIENGNTSAINLPSANVVSFELEDGSVITVRPSGTEPKLKVYFSLKCKDISDAEEKYDKIYAEIANDYLG